MKNLLTICVLIFSAFSCHEKTSLTPHAGYLDVPGGKIWYEVVGEGPNPPVLLLH